MLEGSTVCMYMYMSQDLPFVHWSDNLFLPVMAQQNTIIHLARAITNSYSLLKITYTYKSENLKWHNYNIYLLILLILHA